MSLYIIMSIPSYQFASLQMENDAKKRVMKRAKKGFETEEQRAIKSGRVVDSIKNVYSTIIANLEMQKSTIVIAEAFIESVAYEAVVYRPPRINFDDDASLMGDEEDKQERSLGSYLFATLGKIVSLSSQLVSLVKKLGEEVYATGKPATASIGITKIISLMEDIDKLYGNWGVSGLAKAISVMATALQNSKTYPPQLDGLLQLWEENNMSARDILEKIQSNQYTTSFESINIPSKTKNPVRRANIARGEEKRDYTSKEYKLLLQLRQKGLLSGDDFTSVYSGEDGDDSTISTFGTLSSASSSDSDARRVLYTDSDSDDESGAYADARRRARREADRNVFGRVPDSDDDTVSAWSGQSYYADLKSLPSVHTEYRHMPSNYFDDDSTISSGSGLLYTLPSKRTSRPLRYY